MYIYVKTYALDIFYLFFFNGSSKKGLIVAVQSLSRVQLFVIPWTEACHAPLASTIFWSLLKFTPMELVMLANLLILCRPFLFFWLWENNHLALLALRCLLCMRLDVSAFSEPEEQSEYILRM